MLKILPRRPADDAVDAGSSESAPASDRPVAGTHDRHAGGMPAPRRRRVDTTDGAQQPGLPRHRPA